VTGRCVSVETGLGLKTAVTAFAGQEGPERDKTNLLPADQASRSRWRRCRCQILPYRTRRRSMSTQWPRYSLLFRRRACHVLVAKTKGVTGSKGNAGRSSSRESFITHCIDRT